jgi:hypothetical protein
MFADVILATESGQDSFCQALGSALTAGTPTPTAEDYADFHMRIPTNPRDLAIANAFAQCPPLWDLLALGAQCPAAFLPCTAVVVSLLALVSGKWCSFANAREDGPLFAKKPFTLAAVRSLRSETVAMVVHEPRLHSRTNILLRVAADALLVPSEAQDIAQIVHLLSAREVAALLLHLHRLVLAAPPILSQLTRSKGGVWNRTFPDDSPASDLTAAFKSACFGRMDSAAGLVFHRVSRNGTNTQSK